MKIVKEKPTATSGYVLLHVPNIHSDPVRVAKTHKFFIRVGESTHEMPYETLKRMFLGTTTPDLHVIFAVPMIRLSDNSRRWDIPVTVANRIGVTAKSVAITIEFCNPESCELIETDGNLRDYSNINIGQRLYGAQEEQPIHRGLDIVFGRLYVQMKPRKTKLLLRAELFAEDMRAKRFEFSLYLHASGEAKVKLDKEENVY